MSLTRLVNGVRVVCTHEEETEIENGWASAPGPTPAQVKVEAGRRILALCPEWKQRNLTARAVTLAEKGRANWTAEELAEWQAGEALWDQITAIRAASDILEAAVPIPDDYSDDSHWP